MQIKHKNLILSLALVFVSASCNFFSQALPSGIIKTVNGGTDWQFSNTAKDNPNASMSGQNISKLEFDPANRQVIYAASYNGGLFKSEDAAATWKSILTNIFVYDFFVVKEDPKIIYVSGFYNNHGRVLKTTDGGGSWVQIYNEASAGNAVRSISRSPLNPSQIIIGTAQGTLIKSMDGGNTWQLVRDFKAQINRVAWGSQAIYVLLKGTGLEVSTDFGNNFKNTTQALTDTYNLSNFSYNAQAVDNFSQIYISESDENLMYITTDKGLFKTLDGGKTWNKMSLPVKTDSGATKAIAVNKFNPSIVYTSVNATIYKSSDGGSTWQTQIVNNAGGFVNYLLVDPELAQIVYGGLYASE